LPNEERQRPAELAVQHLVFELLFRTKGACLPLVEVALYDKTIGVGENDVQFNGLGTASLNTLVPCKDMVSLGVNALTKKLIRRRN